MTSAAVDHRLRVLRFFPSLRGLLCCVIRPAFSPSLFDGPDCLWLLVSILHGDVVGAYCFERSQAAYSPKRILICDSRIHPQNKEENIAPWFSSFPHHNNPSMLSLWWRLPSGSSMVLSSWELHDLIQLSLQNLHSRLHPIFNNRPLQPRRMRL